MNCSKRDLEILYSDKYIIAVNKPAGLVVQGARFREESLLELTKEYIKSIENRHSNVFLAVVHRLDKPVSGVCLFARRSKTAGKLFSIIEKKMFIKIYLAKVEGSFRENEGLLVDYLEYIDGRARVVEGPDNAGRAKSAVTLFQLVRRNRSESLLLLSPLTGRKHQLRIALAKRGHPIIGDTKYGSKRTVLRGRAILLHALLFALPHPHLGILLEIYAPLPSYFGVPNLDKAEVLEFLNKVRKYYLELRNPAEIEGGYNVSS